MAGSEGPPDPRLLEEGLRLVDAIARKLARAAGAGFAFEDLRSAGREGLLDALQRFDPERGVPFRAYAAYRIRGSMVDGMRALGHLPRRTYERLRALDAARAASEGAAEDVLAQPAAPGQTPADAERVLGEHLAGMATAMALGLVAAPARPGSEDLVGESRHDDPEEALTRAQLLALVKRGIEELPEVEATLVRRHYLEGERFDHIAQDLGLSKSWASRLHTRAMQRLAASLGGATSAR